MRRRLLLLLGAACIVAGGAFLLMRKPLETSTVDRIAIGMEMQAVEAIMERRADLIIGSRSGAAHYWNDEKGTLTVETDEFGLVVFKVWLDKSHLQGVTRSPTVWERLRRLWPF